MTETMRQIADAGEALGFLCSSVRCGTEWGPEHDRARDVLRAALRRVAEPVDHTDRMAARMGAEFGPRPTRAEIVAEAVGGLRSDLAAIAEPVDRVERVARALFAHDEDGNSPVKMWCNYEQLKTHQRLAYEAKARAAIAALEDTRDASN